jgi:hypothetical protein
MMPLGSKPVSTRRRDQLRTEQPLVETGVRKTVPVLAGDGATQLADDVDDRVCDLAHVLPTC